MNILQDSSKKDVELLRLNIGNRKINDISIIMRTLRYFFYISSVSCERRTVSETRYRKRQFLYLSLEELKVVEAYQQANVAQVILEKYNYAYVPCFDY